VLNLLAGIKILDLTTVVLGPYATLLLGDLGADVIKIETLEGDAFRSVRPGRSAEMGAGFLNLNRNKRSLAINLRDPEARQAFEQLVASADVLTHNMRTASAERLGIGFSRLREVNPRLVYCSTPGFGSDGPDADQPAYDDTIQARSGLAFLNASASGEPRFLPTIAADKVGGLHLAIAVLAGLAARDRQQRAVSIEVPMFESLVSFVLIEQLAGRSFDPPIGGMSYDRLTSPHRKPHRTGDGYISILPYSTEHWRAFFRLIGRPDMCDDPRVVDPVVRSQNVSALYAMVSEAMPRNSTAEWLALLVEHDIPCAPVSRLEDLLTDDHLQSVGMFRNAMHPSEGNLVSVRSPFQTKGDRAVPDKPAPRIGADSRSVLSEAGLDDAVIERLVRAGAIRDARQHEGSESEA